MVLEYRHSRQETLLVVIVVVIDILCLNPIGSFIIQPPLSLPLRQNHHHAEQHRQRRWQLQQSFFGRSYLDSLSNEEEQQRQEQQPAPDASGGDTEDASNTEEDDDKMIIRHSTSPTSTRASYLEMLASTASSDTDSATTEATAPEIPSQPPPPPVERIYGQTNDYPASSSAAAANNQRLEQQPPGDERRRPPLPSVAADAAAPDTARSSPPINRQQQPRPMSPSELLEQQRRRDPPLPPPQKGTIRNVPNRPQQQPQQPARPGSTDLPPDRRAPSTNAGLPTQVAGTTAARRQEQSSPPPQQQTPRKATTEQRQAPQQTRIPPTPPQQLQQQQQSPPPPPVADDPWRTQQQPPQPVEETSRKRSETNASSPPQPKAPLSQELPPQSSEDLLGLAPQSTTSQKQQRSSLDDPVARQEAEERQRLFGGGAGPGGAAPPPPQPDRSSQEIRPQLDDPKQQQQQQQPPPPPSEEDGVTQRRLFGATPPSMSDGTSPQQQQQQQKWNDGPSQPIDEAAERSRLFGGDASPPVGGTMNGPAQWRDDATDPLGSGQEAAERARLFGTGTNEQQPPSNGDSQAAAERARLFGAAPSVGTNEPQLPNQSNGRIPPPTPPTVDSQEAAERARLFGASEGADSYEQQQSPPPQQSRSNAPIPPTKIDSQEASERARLFGNAGVDFDQEAKERDRLFGSSPSPGTNEQQQTKNQLDPPIPPRNMNSQEAMEQSRLFGNSAANPPSSGAPNETPAPPLGSPQSPVDPAQQSQEAAERSRLFGAAPRPTQDVSSPEEAKASFDDENSNFPVAPESQYSRNEVSSVLGESASRQEASNGSFDESPQPTNDSQQRSRIDGESQSPVEPRVDDVVAKAPPTEAELAKAARLSRRLFGQGALQSPRFSSAPTSGTKKVSSPPTSVEKSTPASGQTLNAKNPSLSTPSQTSRDRSEPSDEEALERQRLFGQSPQPDEAAERQRLFGQSPQPDEAAERQKLFGQAPQPDEAAERQKLFGQEVQQPDEAAERQRLFGQDSSSSGAGNNPPNSERQSTAPQPMAGSASRSATETGLGNSTPSSRTPYSVAARAGNIPPPPENIPRRDIPNPSKPSAADRYSPATGSNRNDIPSGTPKKVTIAPKGGTTEPTLKRPWFQQNDEVPFEEETTDDPKPNTKPPKQIDESDPNEAPRSEKLPLWKKLSSFLQDPGDQKSEEYSSVGDGATDISDSEMDTTAQGTDTGYSGSSLPEASEKERDPSSLESLAENERTTVAAGVNATTEASPQTNSSDLVAVNATNSSSTEGDVEESESLIPPLVFPKVPPKMEVPIEIDEAFMQLAIALALNSRQNEDGTATNTVPVGAVLVAKSREIIGEGSSFDPNKAILAAVDQSGFKITGSSENLFREVVKSSETEELEKQLSGATLYVTLEPDHPGTTDMVRQAGIGRIVIGTANAITNGAELMAKTLETAGYDVILGKILKEECDELIRSYTEHNFDRMTMAYFENCGRPLGVLHCSVIDSDNIKSFADKGNSFLKLSFTDCDTFQIAPPPDEMNDASPWQVRIYEHANAIVVTFPRKGNGSAVDDSIQNRLEGLKWLATHASFLPKEAVRILVVDAADLRHIPLSNDDPNTPKNVDIDAFWQSGCRILLRRVQNEYAQASALAAAQAAAKAAESAAVIAEAIDFPETAKTAELVVEYQKSAQLYTENLGKMLKEAEDLRTQFKKLGVKIEFVEGGDPIDIMRHLGTQFKSVVWRAGFWGDKGAKAIYGGAFQVVSAHVAVASADCLQELERAKNTVQAACGKPSSVQILADEEDMSLQHELGTAHVDGRPVRHVRVDCGLCFPKTQEVPSLPPPEESTA